MNDQHGGMEEPDRNGSPGDWNWWIAGGIVGLICAGLWGIYNARLAYGVPVAQRCVLRQLFWVSMGGGLFCWLSNRDYRSWRDASWLFYGVSVLSLVLVLVFGARLWGARRWLDLGIARVQPAEFAKLALLAALAWWASHCRGRPGDGDVWFLCGGMLVAGVPLVLIFLEPALGTTLVICVAIATVALGVGFSRRGLTVLFLSAVILAGGLSSCYHLASAIRPLGHDFHVRVLARAGLKRYQIARVERFLRRSRSNVFVGGHNEVQSLITIGQGNLFGGGAGAAAQIQDGFLPPSTSHNDFIFSVLSGVGGFSLGAGIILLETALILWCLQVARGCRDVFGRALCLGVSGLFFAHLVIPVCVCLRLCPATGLNIYLVSYGGSAMLTALAALGIVQSVYRYCHTTPPKGGGLRESLPNYRILGEVSLSLVFFSVRFIYAE